ncbi:MAG: Manganese-dependent inorganic pyrophosphatase [Candidatus Methanolliviera sp. GoM_oil]|nr:MAG: Manganese-dependent inorganic pyrophosphatase [Candidatus Methanolliviera sp. GoM_oil]
MGDIYVIGHKNPDTDSICSAIAYAYFKGEDVVAARCGEINAETSYVLEYFDLDPPILISDGSGKRFILVDHNELSQSVDNMDQAEILEVIDHHKINFSCSSPITFHAEPVGSTATMIAERYIGKIKRKIAGILLSAILSDTIVLTSTTTTERDKEIVKKLAPIAGIEDIKVFGMEIKKKKSSLKGLTASKIILSDFKDFEFGEDKVGIGQIEVVDFKESEERKDELIQELEKLKGENNYSLLSLMVTNIVERASKLFVVGDRSKAEEAFKKPVKDNSLYLDGAMSRKKDVVPFIERVFR